MPLPVLVWSWPEGPARGKYLEPGRQRLESLATGIWSKFLNLPMSSALKPDISAYLLSKNLKKTVD